jgi:hypothetical protein
MMLLVSLARELCMADGSSTLSAAAGPDAGRGCPAVGGGRVARHAAPRRVRGLGRRRVHALVERIARTKLRWTDRDTGE